MFVHFEEGREALEDTPNKCVFQLMACIQNSIVNVIQEVPIQPQQMLDRGKDCVDLQVRASVKVSLNNQRNIFLVHAHPMLYLLYLDNWIAEGHRFSQGVYEQINYLHIRFGTSGLTR